MGIIIMRHKLTLSSGPCWCDYPFAAFDVHQVACAVCIGTKQKELEAGSMQLMHPYTPWATVLLAGQCMSLWTSWAKNPLL